MEIKTKDLPKSEIELRISVSVEELKEFQDRVVLSLGKDIEISGFRRGRAPREIIKKKIGQERIFKEAVEICIKENYTKAIRRLINEKKIEPLGQPEIEIIKLAPGNPLEFKAKVPVFPWISLPDYKAIASGVKRKKVSVSEEEVAEALKWLQESRAKFIAKAGQSQKGDFVEIEFSSPQIENGAKKKESFVLGKGHFVSGFEENLAGMKNGEEREFSLHLSGDLSKPEEGERDMNFKVRMVSIQKMDLPDITDEWAKSLGQFENLTALKKSIKDGLVLEKERAENQRVRQEIIKNISEKVKTEIPENLIEEEKNRMNENLKQGVSKALHISFQEYLKQVNKTEESIKESFSLEARKRVKNTLVLRAIEKREGVVVSQGEIEEEVNKILKKYSSVNKAQSQLDIEKLKAYVKRVLKDEKAFQILESFVNS